jgi:hypothetical protein
MKTKAIQWATLLACALTSLCKPVVQTGLNVLRADHYKQLAD